MDWMLDEYEIIVGEKRPATFTGKSIEKGGSKGRTEATGRGGVIIMQRILKAIQNDTNLKGKKPQDITIAIQGFGNVGLYFGILAQELGYKIVAVSDSKGGIIKSKKVKGKEQKVLEVQIEELGPLDIRLVSECKKEKGSLSGCYCSGGVCDLNGGTLITNGELLELPVDILIPSALENVIDSENMRNIRARIIIEMANGPITEEAYEYLSKKGVVIVPDVLANSGGVTVSYLEWVQGKQGYWWNEEEVNTKLVSLMEKATDDIIAHMKNRKISMKQSAFEVAIKRIAGGLAT